MFRSLLNGIKDLVYPPICTHCRENITQNPYKGICSKCAQLSVFNKPPFCLKCSRHINARQPDPLCNSCQTNPMHFDYAIGACQYTPFMRNLIHQFKYHQKTYLKHVLANYIIQYVEKHNIDIDQFDYFLPMPLSKTRLRERGYNQSLLISQILAKQYNKPLYSNVLTRNRHTRTQSTLSQKERFTNVDEAFRIKPSSRFINKNILIIDDLLTTGATASSAALTVKQTKANKVFVITIAII